MNASIQNGAHSDTLQFLPNKTFIRSSGLPYISTGNWTINGNRINTTNSRFEPAQVNTTLNPTFILDQVKIIKDILQMSSK